MSHVAQNTDGLGDGAGASRLGSVPVAMSWTADFGDNAAPSAGGNTVRFMICGLPVYLHLICYLPSIALRSYAHELLSTYHIVGIRSHIFK